MAFPTVEAFPSSTAFRAVEAFQFRPLVNGFSGGRSLPLSSPRQWLFRRSKPSAFVPTTMTFWAVEAFRFRQLHKGFSGGRGLPLVNGFSGGEAFSPC
jgi:myo-inositol catabolism protein IolC